MQNIGLLLLHWWSNLRENADVKVHTRRNRPYQKKSKQSFKNSKVLFKQNVLKKSKDRYGKFRNINNKNVKVGTQLNKISGIQTFVEFW